MLKDKRKLIYPVAFLLLVGAGFAYKIIARNNYSGIPVSVPSGSESVVCSDSQSDAVSEMTSEKIKIYICGEIMNPGVYEVDKGTILNDVALLAGGFTDMAATDYLNLVYSFENNMSVFIPNEDNLDEGDRVIMRKYNENTASDGGGSLNAGALVNINTATLEELKTLPGIGESTAGTIIAYREEHRFERIEDIMNVSGIGEAKFSRIRQLITV